MAQQYKRRLIPIVDRAFQFKYTGIILAVAVVTSTILGFFLWRSYLEMNEILSVAGVIPEIGEQLNSADSKKVFLITIAALVGEVVVLGVLGLLITHRVCGPIFVITRHLTTMAEGKLPAVRPLRAGDEFATMFETFRKVVEDQKGRDRSEADKLKPIVAAARAKGLAEGDIAVLQALIDAREARLQG